ncbi:MAG: hypothetical protein SOW18_01520 [Peptoniphilus sp.]|nr:hypothetical protein [Peptoniphilus sp.]MDY3118198.1 hypothetical protein [Peptoniphilus sp.]
MLESRIKQLSVKSVDRVQASNAEFPYQEIHVKIEGVKDTLATQALKSMLHERRMRCLKMTVEIERFIASIEDSRIRMVFERRYISGWSWQKIARSMGSADESYARKLVDRYLEKRGLQ